MKLLHTSDWHLGASERDRTYYDDQKAFIDEICSVCVAEQVDAVLVAGDVFDRSMASSEAISLYDYAVTRLCSQLGKEVLLIAGNHDSPERLSSCRTLLERSGLHILGRLEAEPVFVRIGNADIYLLPWFQADRVRFLYPDNADEISSLTDAFRVVCHRLKESFVPGQRHIVLSHAFIVGSETSKSDRAAQIGSAEAVSADVFDGFDYVALGHIHKPQEFSGNIRYSGTPMAYSFGKEEKQEKSVTILDTDTMERKIIGLHPLHGRLTLNGTYEDLKNISCTEDVRNSYLRIEVTDRYVGYAMASEFRMLFPNYLEIEGLGFENLNRNQTISPEEFRNLESDPEAVFQSYCRECTGTEPEQRLLELFKKAGKAWEEEDNA